MKIKIRYKLHPYSVAYFMEIEGCPSVEAAKVAFRASYPDRIFLSAEQVVPVVHPVTQVEQEDAERKLVAFIKETDLDDLAAMYSRYIADGPVAVDWSDVFKDGKRVKQISERV